MASLDQIGQGDDPTAYRKALALALMRQGLDTSPVKHWTEGAARLANALVGSMWQNQNTEDQRDASSQLSSLLSPNTTASPPIPKPQSAIQSAPLPGAPSTRGMRNNNPGNIEDGPFAKGLPGYAGTDGRFAKFASAEHGMGAIDSLLQNYGRQGINTVGGVINRWAPPSDNNPTSTYAATVARALGTDPNTPVDLNDPAIRQKIALGIGKFENGTAFTPPQIAPAPVAQDAIPQGAQPTAMGGQQQIDIKQRIAQLLSSPNPYAQKLGLQLAGQAISPALQSPQAMKIQNRDGSESIVFVNPAQMQTYGAGGKPVDGDKLGGGTPMPDLSGERYAEYLQQSDPGRANLINGMLTGRIAPAQLGRYGTKQVQTLLEDAARIRPDFDMTKWAAASKMQNELASGQVNALGGKLQAYKNSFEHLANVSDAALKKGNADLGTPFLSAPYNYLTSQTTGQQDIANTMEREASIYGGERTKALTGRAGTEAEREDLKNRLGANTTAGPAQAGSIEGEYIQLKDALENQERQIRETLGERGLKEHPVIDEHMKAAMKRIEGNLAKLRGKEPVGTAAGGFTPPSDWQFSPSRKQYRDPQGNIYDQNGQPVK